MNDTSIKGLSRKHQVILRLYIKDDSMQSSDVFEALNSLSEKRSLVSVKRDLTEMVKFGLLTISGAGRSTSYKITTLGRLLCDIDVERYMKIDPDKRYGQDGYNFDLIRELPLNIFDEEELFKLDATTIRFQERQKTTSETIRQKELQRLVIELSWKSSKIEGNTYTLLDTEKLILEAKEADGHSKDEAIMILNHKAAFEYIHENRTEFKKLSISNLEDLHSILIKDLNVKAGLRNSLVGITGSKYKPLDNKHQIREALEELSVAISRMDNPYTRALFALLAISYIQPFEDGNKRASRLMANAILLAHNCAPISYRSVDEGEYRGAVLVFYELNSITALKKIFIDQYVFATKNYSL